ncbi:hypothetical protein [Castellaniella sp. MT123]|uniref:hypothetical protein n=1 Tax=unclassified Castellaniella TaxID=2617606 RepID=UPI0031F37813
MKHESHAQDRLRANESHRRDLEQSKQNDLQSAQDHHQHDPAFYDRIGLPDSEPKSGHPGERFLISIYGERWTPEDREAGQFSEGTAEIERETVDTDTLQRIGQDYGLDLASASDPRHTPYLWFSSSTPREDQEYFGQGVHKYYSLHIHEVNGHRPEPSDIQRIADLIGVRFDHPLQLQAPTHEQEGPDLCL